MFGRLFGFMAKDVAMDLGTANTLIYVKNHGIVLNEPSVVAVNIATNKVIAVGSEAKSYMGRTPEKIEAIRPLRDGVIADFDVARAMIKYFLERVRTASRIFRPRLVVGVPTGITQVEKRAVIESAEQAGAREVYLIEEPHGRGNRGGFGDRRTPGQHDRGHRRRHHRDGHHLLSATAYKESIRVAGDELNESIMRYLRSQYSILVGENTAERVKWQIGRAYPAEDLMWTTVAGRDIVSGIPKQVQVNDGEIREAMWEPIQAIHDSCLRALEKVPPEMSADIAERGIVLAGGGGLLGGLDTLIRERTGLPVYIAPDPLTSVVMGAGRVLSDMKKFRGVFIN